jgi:hypothetical protein
MVNVWDIYGTICMELWNIYGKDHQSASNFGYLGYPPKKINKKTEKKHTSIEKRYKNDKHG